MLVCQAFAEDGDDQSKDNCESTGEHICPAPDDITHGFCRAIREQDPVAMNEVLEELVDRATRYVTPLFQNWQLSHGVAEIAACKALEKVVRQAHKFDCSRPILPWVCTIACNEAISIHRAKEKLKLVSLFMKDGRTGDAGGLAFDFADRPPTETILDEFVRREDRARLNEDLEALRSAIAQLPPIEREVVESRLAGQRNRVIAKSLSMENQKVAVIYFRSKRRLRRALSDCIDAKYLAGKRQKRGLSSKKSPKSA